MSEAVGSLAEEAAKLVNVLEDWWSGARGRLGDAAGGVAGAAAAHQGPECKVCPVCQALSLLRTARPETFEHLVSASQSLVLALRSALDAHTQRAEPGASAQRIDIV
jgi:hypothetical protein